MLSFLCLTFLSLVRCLYAADLRVVSSVTSDRVVNDEVQQVALSWERYCALHGCSFHLHEVPDDFHGRRSFFAARWHAILTQHFAPGRWILAVDIDTVVGNMSRSFHGLMQQNETDLYLQVRENRVVTAAFVFFRCTPFTSYFLKRWLALSTVPLHNHNYDNGDLLTLLMDLLDAPAGRLCRHLRFDYKGYFIPCFANSLARILARPIDLPIRFLFPLEGYWRSHEGISEANTPGPFEAVYFSCWSNDFLLHGWKTISAMWFVAGENTTSWPLTSPRCRYHRELELEMATSLCMWHFPDCINGTRNACRDSCTARCGRSWCLSGAGTLGAESYPLWTALSSWALMFVP